MDYNFLPLAELQYDEVVITFSFSDWPLLPYRLEEMLENHLQTTLGRLNFGEKLRYLTAKYLDKNYSHRERIFMFKELIGLLKAEESFVMIFKEIKQDLRKYYEELLILNNFDLLRFFEQSFPDVEFHKQVHKHLYTDAHNVHKIVNPTVDVARQIIEKYPAVYVKPFEHDFFTTIEKAEPYHDVSLTELFASINLMIRTHKHKKEMRKRLMEEINESSGVCITGHITRLINSIRGFDDVEFDIIVDNYEIDRARIFHQFNNLVDLDNFMNSVETISNEIIDQIETPPALLLQILKDYTKREWCLSNGKFTMCENI